MLKKYRKYILNAVKINEMDILPGHLSFSLIFMIIPIIAFIGLIVSKIDINFTSNFINKNVPLSVISLINISLVDSNNINIFIFAIISLLLSSKGIRAIIISSNILFKIKETNAIKIRVKSFLITIILFILIAFTIIVLVLGDVIINYFNNSLSLNISTILNNIYNLLKYPISISLMFLLIKILYTISPTVKINSYYMNKGSFFTTIMWLISSRIYSFYLNNYNHYNLYYGSMSNILILLVWLYLLSYIFVIGMSINASFYLDNCK